jgi:hypothetical protein
MHHRVDLNFKWAKAQVKFQQPHGLGRRPCRCLLIALQYLLIAL